MKKTCHLFWLLVVFIFAGYGFLVSPVLAASPHLEFSPSSGVITTGGTNIIVKIDTAGQAAKSAKAVINFDAAKLEVASIQAGDFFDDVSHNIYNSTGQVVINANLSLGSMLESKTGTGTLATMTVKAKASSGTAAMTFDCTAGSSTDSNINDPTPVDIIVCASNVNGSYTLGSGGTTTTSPSPSAASGTGGTTSPSPSPSAVAVSGGTGGAAPVPVTGTPLPTIILLGFGLLLILAPVFL